MVCKAYLGTVIHRCRLRDKNTGVEQNSSPAFAHSPQSKQKQTSLLVHVFWIDVGPRKSKLNN